MENKICVDTDIVIDVLRGKEGAVEFVKQYEKNHEMCMATMTLFELYIGAFRGNWPSRVESIDLLEERFTFLPLSHRAAKEAARIHAFLMGKGHMLDYKDVIIAAIAKVNGCTFKTGNIKHFRRIDGLRVL